MTRQWALAALVLGLGSQSVAAPDEPSLRIDRPEERVPAVPDQPFLYDPLADLRRSADRDDLKLGGPFYAPDAVAAALKYLPYDTPLGPPDIADYAWTDRMERLGAYATALARNPRHHETIFGMPCDLASPLAFVCHVPGTDCIVGVGFPPMLLCPF